MLKSGGRVPRLMDLKRLSGFVFVSALLLLLLCNTCSVRAGDIVHDDENAPKKPGCENDFVLVYSDAPLTVSVLFKFGFFASSFVLFADFVCGFLCNHGLVAEKNDDDCCKRFYISVVV